jgi:carbamoyltransferase
MDASFMLQYLTEKYFLEAIGYLKQKFPSCKKLALAGGLFSNVKLNQKINELSEFDEIFIAPGMGDGGLAIGAAIAKANELGEFDVQTIDNVFWGNKTDTNFIHPGVEETELNYSQIASELSEGKVVGIFSNRREWGPRALGGTSIMFDPRREDAQEYVNRRLNRNEVMPFAPVVMDGFESVPFYCYKSKYASQFMTICYPVKEEWVNKIPGVINRFDNTSRIQIAKKDNKPFFPILEAFKEITGVPVLMNTSFNVHGEPIINETEQAMKHLVNGVVDILVVDDKVYRKKTSVFDI